MVQWFVGSILHGRPIELFLGPASAPQLVYVLSCLWDDAYKRSKRVAHVVVAEGFLSHYLSGPLPYVRIHITVLNCVECIVK